MKNISLVLCFKEICMISLCCTLPWRLASHKVETDRSGFVLMHIPYSLLPERLWLKYATLWAPFSSIWLVDDNLRGYSKLPQLEGNSSNTTVGG